MKSLRVILISGLSGSGKTTAIKALENIGFYCVDNLPILLIPKFLELCGQSRGKISRVAVFEDIREADSHPASEPEGTDFFEDSRKIIEDLRKAGFLIEILFLAYGIFRADTGDFLGAVGDRYTPIQNEYLFNFVDTLLESGDAHYESAGALGTGERLWVLARVPSADFEIAEGDAHKSYLMFCSSHDGSLSATSKVTSIRVVSNNALNQALKGDGNFMKVKHTRDAEIRLNRAKALISGTMQTVDTLKEKLDLLAQRQLTREVYKDSFERIFPKPAEKTSTTRW